MDAYLAASYRRREEMVEKAAELKSIGIDVTARWITGSHSDADEDKKRHAANEDLEDIRRADIFVLFTEEPSVGFLSGGRHVETGYAYAISKRIILIGPRENVFHSLVDVLQFDTWEEFVAFISGYMLSYGSGGGGYSNPLVAVSHTRN